MSCSTTILRAYYLRKPIRSGYILVSTDHHRVDNGFSLPKLDDYFLDVSKQIQTSTFFFAETRDRFTVYYHHDCDGVDYTGTELIVFRQGINSGRLVNLRLTDDSFVQTTITRFRNLHEGNYVQMTGVSQLRSKVIEVCILCNIYLF